MPKTLSTRVMFRKLPFERITRDIVRDMGEEMRFSDDAINLIRSETEEYLIGLYRTSNTVSRHAGRMTLMKKDLELVRRIRGGF